MKWVTRAPPKIDRIACQWLFSRFNDQSREFLLVRPQNVLAVAEKIGATPYDLPKIEMTHLVDRYSFDAFTAFIDSHGLPDSALLELALIVRGAGIWRRNLTPQSPGLIVDANNSLQN